MTIRRKRLGYGEGCVVEGLWKRFEARAALCHCLLALPVPSLWSASLEQMLSVMVNLIASAFALW